MTLAFLLGLLIATAGTATAAKLITGKQIKDGTISNKDLSKAVRAQLAKAGVPGPAGGQGPKGDPGATGAKGDSGSQGPGARSFVTSSAKGSGSLDLATLDNGLKVVGLCASIGVSVTVETTSAAETFEGSGLVSKRNGPPETYPVAVGPGVVTTGFGFSISESGHLDLVGRDKALGGKLAHVAVGGFFDNGTGCRFWGTITPTT